MINESCENNKNRHTREPRERAQVWGDMAGPRTAAPDCAELLKKRRKKFEDHRDVAFTTSSQQGSKTEGLLEKDEWRMGKRATYRTSITRRVAKHRVPIAANCYLSADYEQFPIFLQKLILKTSLNNSFLVIGISVISKLFLYPN